MSEDFTATVSAFVDGEMVDPGRLALALEDREARAVLVDFVRLRAAVRAGDSPLPASLSTVRYPRLLGRPMLKWPAVAALLLLVFLAGMAVPRASRIADEASHDTPPQPARIEKFTPGVDWHPSN